MTGPQAAWLSGGRLHLSHGPIDLVIGASGPGAEPALAAAEARFQTVLPELVQELPLLRRKASAERPTGAVARRMHRAVHPHMPAFITPMAAVAGSVADEILAAMRTAGGVTRAYVNNGGDIALHVSGAERFKIAMRGEANAALGQIELTAKDCVGGVATSGRGGRSLSLGIADSVTVLAKTAAEADAAATLIANAVDLPGHPAVTREPAEALDPDTDLKGRQVVTGCATLKPQARAKALSAGLARAAAMRRAGLILGAALTLQGKTRTLAHTLPKEPAYA